MKLENIRKIFVLGDLHLGVRNNSVEWSSIQGEFLVDTFLKEIENEGFDPETDILVQVGDWNHVRESTNTRIYKLSLSIADAFTKKFKRGVFVILGNHDVYYKDRTDTHSLEGFDRIYKNFRVYETPEILTINSHKFLMLPWIEKLEDLRNQIRKNSSAKYVFCHADVKGFSLNKFTKLEHGLEADDITSFERIYSGHIHIHQQKGNVLYVGTPYEMDRGDRGNPKGFYVLDVSGSQIKEKFVPNKVSPKYLKFDILDILKLTSQEIKEIFKNNFIDLLIESEFSKKFPLSQFTELVREYGHRQLEFASYSKEQLKTRSEIELNANYEYNIFTILNERIRLMDLPTYSANQMSSKFKEIYDSLRNTKKYD